MLGFYHENRIAAWSTDNERIYMDSPSNAYFLRPHRGFIRLKNGFITPIVYKVGYHIQEEKFQVAIRNIKMFSEQYESKLYIITDKKGIINDMSALAYSYF